MVKVYFAPAEADSTAAQQDIRDSLIADLELRGVSVTHPETGTPLPELQAALTFDGLVADITSESGQKSGRSAAHELLRAAALPLPEEELAALQRANRARKVGHEVLLYSIYPLDGVRAKYRLIENVSVRQASSATSAHMMSFLFAVNALHLPGQKTPGDLYSASKVPQDILSLPEGEIDTGAWTGA
jgi:hypothetical protein